MRIFSVSSNFNGKVYMNRLTHKNFCFYTNLYLSTLTLSTYPRPLVATTIDILAC